jgi:hypothetical protein
MVDLVITGHLNSGSFENRNYKPAYYRNAFSAAILFLPFENWTNSPDFEWFLDLNY